MKPFSNQKVIDEAINKFDQQLMNNSKWRKVCKMIYDQENDYSVNIKYVDDKQTSESMNYDLEFEHIWIQECRPYNEVEYVEIQKYYSIKDHHYSDPRTIEQNLENIHQQLNEIGVLPIEIDEHKIRIYGYQ